MSDSRYKIENDAKARIKVNCEQQYYNDRIAFFGMSSYHRCSAGFFSIYRTEEQVKQCEDKVYDQFVKCCNKKSFW
jgi:hypothetical protein